MEDFSLLTRKSLTFSEDFSQNNDSLLLFEVDSNLLEQLKQEKVFRIKGKYNHFIKVDWRREKT